MVDTVVPVRRTLVANSALPPRLLLASLAILLWSAIHPHDYFTWFLEVLPALIGGGVLLATYRRFRFTGLVYTLIFIHAVILMIGGHYTYAEMPLFNWLRDTFGLARNYYDRLGHLAQGFIPAMIVREILLRTSPLQPGKWLTTIVVSVCLAISATYELIEWAVAAATGEAADAFLGTQGDPWDTQWDMFLCLCGSILSLLLLSRLHSRQLSRFFRPQRS
jgi:putative membrane protein